MDPQADERWRAYYEKTGQRPPRRTLLAALDAFGADFRGDAVDLGAGNGRDVVELLRRGWRVLAIDAEPAAIEGLRTRTDLPASGRLETLLGRFEDVRWPAADLVNSSFALPLCPPERFPGLWGRIVGWLRPGGRFAGQLYGERDSWVGRPGMTFLTRAELGRMLLGLEVELLEEEESDGVTPRGNSKHWHVFHLVVRKT